MAPQVTGSQALELRFGNTLQAPDGAPDPFLDNNTTNVTSSFVKNAAGCSFGVAIAQAAFSDTGGLSQVTIAADTGCAVSAVSNVPWLALAVTGTQVTLAAQPNTTPAVRTATVTIAGQATTVNQSGTPTTAITACVTKVEPTAAILAYNATPGVISISTGRRIASGPRARTSLDYDTGRREWIGRRCNHLSGRAQLLERRAPGHHCDQQPELYDSAAPRR